MKLFKKSLPNQEHALSTQANTENPYRDEFPLLANSDLTYLDSGATTHKPRSVLAAEQEYYQTSNANVHRGLYKLAEASTQAYEDARGAVAAFLGCKPDEIIFTSGTTHSMNLAAHIVEPLVTAGDEIVCTVADHHSTFVPFQQLAARTGARFVVVPLVDQTITEEQINKYISPKTKIIAIAHASNVLGYVLDLNKIKKARALLIADAAQSVVHGGTKLGAADMIAFSSHKVYGPMGIGVLAAKQSIVAKGEPLLFGGSMISRVTIEHSTWAECPARYEAGTPNVAGAVGLRAALEYYEQRKNDAHHIEHELTRAAVNIIAKYARVLGPNERSGPIVSFVVPGVHAHDVAQILDSYGVCVRAGQHCCEPLHDALNIDASVRVSLALYNTHRDLQKLEEGLAQVRRVFGNE